MRYRLRAGSLENWKVGFKALGCCKLKKIMEGTTKRHEGKGTDALQYEERKGRESKERQKYLKK